MPAMQHRLKPACLPAAPGKEATDKHAKLVKRQPLNYAEAAGKRAEPIPQQAARKPPGFEHSHAHQPLPAMTELPVPQPVSAKAAQERIDSEAAAFAAMVRAAERVPSPDKIPAAAIPSFNAWTQQAVQSESRPVVPPKVRPTWPGTNQHKYPADIRPPSVTFETCETLSNDRPVLPVGLQHRLISMCNACHHSR